MNTTPGPSADPATQPAADGYVPFNLNVFDFADYVRSSTEELRPIESERVDAAIRHIRDELNGHLTDQQIGRTLLVTGYLSLVIADSEGLVDKWAALASFLTAIGERLFHGDPSLKEVDLDEDPADDEPKSEADAA